MTSIDFNATILPTPRQLLTSIFNTLTSTPASIPPATHPLSGPSHNLPSNLDTAITLHTLSTNPLPSLPPSARTLLTTLHVLFPPPTLLQALDLLDRGLVTRIVEISSIIPDGGNANTPRDLRTAGGTEGVTADPAREETSSVYPPQAPPHLPPQTAEGSKPPPLRPFRNAIYLVRSSQTSRGRGKYGGSEAGVGVVYTVRLKAWSCTCAAFAFAAFPGGGHGDSHAWRKESEVSDDDKEWKWDDGEQEDKDGTTTGYISSKSESSKSEYEFGGLSLDGTGLGEGNVPVCKHLLACSLADRWDAVLGRYVKVKEVEKEEMAGFGAEG